MDWALVIHYSDYSHLNLYTLYQIQKLMRQIRSPLAPLQKGGTRIKVPLLLAKPAQRA
jgi:hypothetical protein